ncbi:MAG: taurine dioxygenase, partial [Candidatus Pelagibacter sp.]|nr:taurine dioxygenase [Candidatus Pelagibacter sp.]
MNIKVEPFKNNIGASISYNLKLADSKIIDQIKETLNNYGFVCFRDQNLEPGEYLKFAEQLGKIKEYPMLKDLENYKGITVVERKEDDKGKSYGEGWHTDSSYLDITPKYTCLMGKIVKRDQGQTLFASQLSSYEALDQETKDKIQNLVGIFSSAGPISVTRLEREAERGTGKSKDFIAEHPIVKKVGSRKALYLSPGHTIAIKDLSEENSKELLKFLFNHQTKKEFQNSFFWEKNTIVIWDNHSVIHS